MIIVTILGLAFGVMVIWCMAAVGFEAMQEEDIVGKIVGLVFILIAIALAIGLIACLIEGLIAEIVITMIVVLVSMCVIGSFASSVSNDYGR